MRKRGTPRRSINDGEQPISRFAGFAIVRLPPEARGILRQIEQKLTPS